MRISIQAFCAVFFAISAFHLQATPRIPFQWPKKSCDDMAKVIASSIWAKIKLKAESNPQAKLCLPAYKKLRGPVAEYCAIHGIKEAFAGRSEIQISSSVKFCKGGQVLAEVDLVVQDLSQGLVDLYEIKNWADVYSAVRKSKHQFGNLLGKLDANREYPWPLETQLLLIAILFGDPSFHFMTYHMPYFSGTRTSNMNYTPLPFSREDMDSITQKVLDEITVSYCSHIKSLQKSL